MNSNNTEHRTPILWLLLLTAIHTVPSIWWLAVVAGVAPLVAFYYVALPSLFPINHESDVLVIFVLIPALLYTALYFVISFALAHVLSLIKLKIVRTALLLAIVSAAVTTAFQPIYMTGGHSSYEYYSIVGLIESAKISTGSITAYTLLLGFIGVLLLVQQAQDKGLPRILLPAVIKQNRLRISAGIGILFLAMFGWSNRALFFCHPLTKTGSSYAQYCVGYALTQVPRNELLGDTPAYEWFERAASQGHGKAAVELLKLPQGRQQRERWLRVAAEGGDHPSQFMLYSHLLKKYSDPAMTAEAIQWLQDSARGGHAAAQFTYAKYLQWGRHVKQNTSEALLWYERAAEQNHYGSIKALADGHASGQLPLDLAKADRYYQQLANQPDKSQLAEFLRANPAVADQFPGLKTENQIKKQREKIAKRRRMVNSDDPEQLQQVALALLKQHNPDASTRAKAISILTQLAEAGDEQIQYDLGRIYLLGSYGVEKNQRLGEQWWSRAADAGHTKSLQDLYHGYKTGSWNVPRDFRKARVRVEEMIDLYTEMRDDRKLRELEKELDYLNRIISSRE